MKTGIKDQFYQTVPKREFRKKWLRKEESSEKNGLQWDDWEIHKYVGKRRLSQVPYQVAVRETLTLMTNLSLVWRQSKLMARKQSFRKEKSQSNYSPGEWVISKFKWGAINDWGVQHVSHLQVCDDLALLVSRCYNMQIHKSGSRKTCGSQRTQIGQTAIHSCNLYSTCLLVECLVPVSKMYTENPTLNWL